MGIGAIALQTSQKKEQSGPPFTSDSANNGLSVDTTSGKIVLGNDVADPLAPARLLSNREIDVDGTSGPFSINVANSVNGALTTCNAESLLVGESLGLGLIQPTIGVLSAGAGAILFAQQGVNKFKVQTNTVDVTVTSSFLNIVVMRLQQSNPYTVHFNAATSNAYNGATVQISGTTTFRRFSQSTNVNVSIDRDLDSGKLWRNSAAVNLTLPNMAAANARPGFILRAWCNNAAGLTITASAGQIIRFGSLATSSGGTLNSIDVGACVTIVNIDSATWITENFCGAWTLT